jgi:type II secretory pathway component HofQ
MKLSLGKFLLATVGLAAASFTVGVLAATPEKTNFHFDNIPVRSALKLIAEEGGFNLVVSDSVQGNISLRLNDVTWQQALDMVLRIKGLHESVQGRTHTVAGAGG